MTNDDSSPGASVVKSIGARCGGERSAIGVKEDHCRLHTGERCAAARILHETADHQRAVLLRVLKRE